MYEKEEEVMTNEELLVAMSNMMDQRLDERYVGSERSSNEHRA